MQEYIVQTEHFFLYIFPLIAMIHEPLAKLYSSIYTGLFIAQVWYSVTVFIVFTVFLSHTHDATHIVSWMTSLAQANK